MGGTCGGQASNWHAAQWGEQRRQETEESVGTKRAPRLLPYRSHSEAPFAVGARVTPYHSGGLFFTYQILINGPFQARCWAVCPLRPLR